MLKEIDFHKALIRALSGKKGILITMPQPLEKLSIEEIRNLEKAGAKCLVDDEESEKPPYEPAIMIESMEDAPVEQSPPHEDAGTGCMDPGEAASTQKIDAGKVIALYNAGWKQKDIAGDMNCSPGSVSIILKKYKEGKNGL